MTGPVIGAESTQPEPEPIVWARPPARPEPVDIDSLDPDTLTELLERSPPKFWRFWPIYGSFLLLLQILQTAIYRPWQHPQGASGAGIAGFVLYSVAGALFIVVSAADLKAAQHARPKLGRNQLLGMCASILTLATVLPWPVFIWGNASVGYFSNISFAIWPILVTKTLTVPARDPSKSALRALREGALPSLPHDLLSLINHLRFRRGDWRFPARLAALGQLVTVLVVVCALFGPYALGWARPLPHDRTPLTSALVAAGAAAFVAARLSRLFAGAPRRRWDVALGSLWIAVNVVVLFSFSFTTGDPTTRPNQLSLLLAASWLMIFQTLTLVTFRGAPTPEEKAQ